MTEISLLKQLITIEKNIHLLNLEIDHTDDGIQRQQLVSQQSELNTRIENLKSALVEIEDKSYSIEAVHGIIRQLKEYITEINKAIPGLRLSRNQGMVIENYLFSYIINDINNLITDEIHGYHIPAYLYYTYRKEESIEISALTNFLNEEIEIISKLENPNYVKLRYFVEGFRDRIIKRFISR